MKFLENRYTKIYFDIIKKAKNLNRAKNSNTYFERHHIYPQSIFPEYKKDKTKMVLLTAREHFICHLLLTKMFSDKPSQYKMTCALNGLRRQNSQQQRVMTGSFYERNKIKMFQLRSDPEVSAAWRSKLGRFGPANHNFGKPGTMTGKKHTPDSIQKMRDKQLGCFPSEETKRKMSAASRGKPKSEETKRKMRNNIWITDGTSQTRIHKDDIIPVGFYRGKMYSPRRKSRPLLPES